MNKHRKAIILSFIIALTVTVICISTSYSFFKIDKKGQIHNKITTGTTEEVCEYPDGYVWNFDYTGTEQEFTVPCSGTYKLETWGAEGGKANIKSGTRYSGGYGSYSIGNIVLQKNKTYINIGGKGEDAFFDSKLPQIGGYNGGGNSATRNASGGGGGAAADSTGGGYCIGGNAGGYKGPNPIPGSESYYNYQGHSYMYGFGGTQTEGYMFGLGQTGSDGAGGGGGSSYIGNASLTDKAMYCYNCTESNEESTRTISTTCHSSTPTENCAKEGNGYARITLVSIN